MRVSLVHTCFVAVCLFTAVTYLCSAQQSVSAANPEFEHELQRGRDALAGQKYDEAVDAFKKAGKLQKGNCADCDLGLAVAYFRKGDQRRGLESCDTALASAIDDRTRAAAHLLKGNLLIGSGLPDSERFPQAEREYRSAVAIVPDDPVAHLNLAKALLKQLKDQEAIVELQKCVALKPPEPLLSDAKKLMEDPSRGRVARAPDFHLTTVQGQEFSLEDLAGKVVVLDFWATWCPPCRESVGELKDLTRKYPSDKMVLISISADRDASAWREFVSKKRMDWPQYLDHQGRMRQIFAVRAFPTYIVIDGEGVIRQRMSGLNPQETIVHRLKNTLSALPTLGAKNQQ